MQYDIEINDTIEVGVIIEAVVCAGRPAPTCSDPSSKDFSDPGDVESIEELTVSVSRINSEGKAVYLDITDFIDEDVMQEIDMQVMTGSD